MGEVNTAQLDGGQWAYRNGSFYATKAASIARMVGMPDRMQLEFDLEWKGSLNIAVALYTDYLQPVSLAEKDSEPDFGGFYSLQLTSYAVNVLMVKQKEPLQYLGMTQTPVFRQGTKAHVDVRTNKADQSISLLVNGKLIKTLGGSRRLCGARQRHPPGASGARIGSVQQSEDSGMGWAF